MNGIVKIKEQRLAPDMIGGIIQTIEEKPIKNLDWIESVTTDKNNTWTVWIKPKATYYPDLILKYNQITKSRLLKGKLYEIENTLTKIYNINKPSL